MRDRQLHSDARMDPTRRPRAAREHADGDVVRATLGLQRLAGNEAVAELVSGSRGAPASGSPAAVAAIGRLPASTAVSAAPTAAVQREPCADCPEAVLRLATPSPGPTTEPGEREQ